MLEQITNLYDTMIIFRISSILAIVTTLIFLIQTILSFSGIDFDGDTDIDVDTDVEELDSFSWFTFKNLMTFLMFSGWGTMSALLNENSSGMSIFYGGLAGIIATIIMGSIFYGLKKLGQENLPTKTSLVGKEGTCSLRIPENGSGKITIVLNGALQEIKAKTKKEECPRGSTILVESVVNDQVIVSLKR